MSDLPLKPNQPQAPLFGQGAATAGTGGTFGRAGMAAFAASGGGGEPVTVNYTKQAGLGTIAISNFFLNLITLWFYRFWAKTRTRRHIWNCVQVNGEPLEYTGTGKELFFGFLIIMGVIFLPLALIVLFFTKGIFYFLYSYVLEWVGQRVIYDLRDRIYTHMHSLSLYFFQKNSTGSLSSRIINDVAMLQGAISNALIRVLRDCVSVVGLLGVIGNRD